MDRTTEDELYNSPVSLNPAEKAHRKYMEVLPQSAVDPGVGRSPRKRKKEVEYEEEESPPPEPSDRKYV